MRPPEDRDPPGPDEWPDEWSGEWSGEHDDDPGEDAPPSWFPGQHLPPDARRMGLDHTVPDGALLDFAGSLDSSKPLHRVTAWAMLVVFAMPAVFYVLRLLRDLGPG